MDRQLRILVVSRNQDQINRITALLESDGYATAGTQLDDIAIDLASSSPYDALLLGGGVTAADGARLRGEIRRRQPDIAVVRAGSPESVLSLLRQEFKALL